MSPEVLLLLLAVLIAESTATVPENNVGKEFLVVFPENIAYYHPSDPQNKVSITALTGDAKVTLKKPLGQEDGPHTINARQTESFNINLELSKTDFLTESQDISISDRILQISSDNGIVVQAFSMRSKSVQTALVIPKDKLGTKYFIPPTPDIQGITDSASFADVNERGPFRLIIVNADQENSITVRGRGTTKTISLKPQQAAQIAVQKGDALRVVEAQKSVAVLFGHPCAIQQSCTCGMLYAMLLPAKSQAAKFPIPPALVKDAHSETSVLLSDSGSSVVKAYNPDSSEVQTAGTAVLYRPGLLLTLIPETDFGSCYTVASIADIHTSAVIVVHKDFKDGVHVGKTPLDNPEWEDVRGTRYVSVKINIAADKTVIWHASSKMAVYVEGQKDGSSFGNPAPIISTTPDYRGCVLTPEVVKIQDSANGWRESIKSCTSESLELVSFSNDSIWKQISSKLPKSGGGGPQEVWIGMRRSSKTGEWYWLDNSTVKDTHWGDDEPGTVDDGQCTVMSLKNNEDFGWRDEDCCKDFSPLCYKGAELLPV